MNKTNIMIRNLLYVALVGAVLTLNSCSTTPEPKGTTTKAVAFQEGVPGGVMVETYQETATVTAIDVANRKVTLISPDGSKTVFKAGPEVINFDRIQVGDKVKATVTEQIVVFLREEGLPSSASQVSTVTLAPKGTKPGVLTTDTVQVTATVKSVDLKNHKAILQFQDGQSKTVAVRPDVDLTKVKLGKEVVISMTEAIAIAVEKP